MNSPIANSTMDHRSIFPIDINASEFIMKLCQARHRLWPYSCQHVTAKFKNIQAEFREFILNDSTPDGYAAI